MLVGHVSWRSETGHTRSHGTLYSKYPEKVVGKVLRETIQMSPVCYSPSLQGWGRWLGLLWGEMEPSKECWNSRRKSESTKGQSHGVRGFQEGYAPGGVQVVLPSGKPVGT